MAKIKLLSNENGLTLLEVVAAILILGIGLLSIGTAICAQYNFINQNRESMLATLAAQEVIEHIRDMSFISILSTNLNSKFNDVNDSRPQALAYLNAPTVNVTRDPDVYGDSSHIQRITVTISWSSSGRTLQKGLATLVTSYGMDNK